MENIFSKHDGLVSCISDDWLNNKNYYDLSLLKKRLTVYSDNYEFVLSQEAFWQVDQVL